ncbi:hypothetical protein BDZ89DRAFT_1153650 [Hymenopellis radicata]|nr:hypothetical protein BDZ89DRAFT_1153650 [Hymenopellis radicata]
MGMEAIIPRWPWNEAHSNIILRRALSATPLYIVVVVFDSAKHHHVPHRLTLFAVLHVGLLALQSDYAEDLRSFLSFDHAESLPPALPDSPRFLPSPKPAPSTVLPSPPAIARTPSSASTRYRRLNRSDALARLEGKGKRPVLATISQNFMSMTDDEGDDEMSSDESSDDDESFIELPPSIRRQHAYSQSSPTVLTNTSTSFFSTKSRSISSRSKHASLQPLQSFMDLKDEDSWRWRSFIEISVA